MTPLESIIKQLILQDGPINIARFMELCLAHPTHGYYMTRDPFGRAGDFTTAPEISQMFGELIGLWAADCWQKMGAPAKVALVELGPGRGTLMSDALRAAKSVPAFRAALDVHLVEISPVLRQIQRATLINFNINWHNSIDTLPACPTIIIANEFFDALPIRQFMKQPSGWHERLVGLNENNELIFGLLPQPEKSLQHINAETSAVLETSEATQNVACNLCQHLKSHFGAALYIDYGHTQSGFGETLQALKLHKMVSPLEAIGEADITAHVDFEKLAKIALNAGLKVEQLTTQAAFLEQLGIHQRAEILIKNAKKKQQKCDIQTALQRLVDPSPKGMGSLFKVLEISFYAIVSKSWRAKIK